MIYILEKAIAHALAQSGFNENGDKIACIEITQSEISVYTEMNYKVVTASGSKDIVPDLKNKVVLYEDEFNIPIDNIDTYLRSRPRVLPIKSKSVDSKGRPLYNIRTLYKMTQARSLFLVVRDLYFRDTAEGKAVIESMQLYEDINRIDAKLFIAEYQAADEEDIILSLAMKHGFNKVKYDKNFKILYGENLEGELERLEDIPKLHGAGTKVLKLNELSYFYKSSIPQELNYIKKSDNYCDKLKSYELFNFNKPQVQISILNNMATSKGITLVNNLISDEVIDYLFPKPYIKFNPSSVACLQLGDISNMNPQYPIETFDEYSKDESTDTTIDEHLCIQLKAMTKKDYDIYIVPNINMVTEDLLEHAIDKHIIVLVKSSTYLQLSDELRNIHDVNVREEFIDKLTAFVNVGRNETECTSYNIIHSTIKTLLKTEPNMLSHFKFNAYIDKLNVSYSNLIFKKFLESEDISTLMMSRGTVPRYIARASNGIERKQFEPNLQVDFMTIMCMLMKLTTKDILQDVKNERISFVRTYSYGKNQKQTVKVTVYSSSDEGFDLNLTIKKYRAYDEEKIAKYHILGCTLASLDESYNEFTAGKNNNLILAINQKRQMNLSVSYYINRYLTEGKTVLVVDPLLSVHEDMFSKQLNGALRILRTKKADMIKHVSADLNPDVIIYHKCDLDLLADVLDNPEDSMFNIFTINVSSEESLKAKMSDSQKAKYEISNKLLYCM